MNRQQRRSAERQTRSAASRDRAELIAHAVAALEQIAASDESVAGATLILPSGETIFLPQPGRREGRG